MSMTQLVDHKQILLGDEAVAAGAIDAGITAAYGYPGTPSTEILDFIIKRPEPHRKVRASWCANEKTALETALGVSFVGRRALVTMKHVGLNVAADPFVNGALVGINGGLVIAVADDPGMHSSQNEQDTRYLADFARVICLEPETPQQAYVMTREAFDLSERFHIPVVVRLVTRLSHSRTVIKTEEPRDENVLSKAPDASSWVLLPVNARRQWHNLVDMQKDIASYTEGSPYNHLTLNDKYGLGVITTGFAVDYYRENVGELDGTPSHLHIGAYPYPVEKIRRLVEHVDRVIVIEEGYPFVERYLRGIRRPSFEIQGKLTGQLPIVGELTPDIVRAALGLGLSDSIDIGEVSLPNRPPQLCKGCPHRDVFQAIQEAVTGYDDCFVASDVGCYTLGALPPYSAIETCVCMGASIGIAKGAAEAGFQKVIAVIGDSTFLHSGVTPLMDAVAANANITAIILDNETIAMTGGQPTILPSSSLEGIVRGIGVEPDHLHVMMAHPKKTAEEAALIRGELEHDGLSVIIMGRECLEKARKRKKR